LSLRGLVLPNRIVTEGVDATLAACGAGLVVLDVPSAQWPERIAAMRAAGSARIGVRASGDADACVAAAKTASAAGAELLLLEQPSVEVVAATRTAWPAERPLGARLALGDDDTADLPRALAAAGCDLIQVVGREPLVEGKAGRLRWVPQAERVRLDAGVVTMSSGGITSAGDANAVLAGGRADLCLIDMQDLAGVLGGFRPGP
jgi:hypothetical protein